MTDTERIEELNKTAKRIKNTVDYGMSVSMFINDFLATVDLINHQQAEIERLQSMNQAKLDMIHDMWEDLDGANFVIEKLKNQLNEEIKDFNQRLRQEIKTNTDYNGCIYYKTAYKIIDNILEKIINENE